MTKKSQILDLIANIGGIAAGLISLIFAVVTATLSKGSYELSETYGGDAYTGIQNAAAQTANNVYYQNEILKTVFCGIFLVTGIVLICVCGVKLINEIMKIAEEKKALRAAAYQAYVAQNAPAAENTVICPQCQAEIKADSKFCTKCGNTIE